jgi:hypothetical protein
MLFLGTIAYCQPKLSLDKSVMDLGTIYQGKTVTTSISLRNAGNAPLKIQDISTSCGCTTVKWPLKVLAPAGREVVDVSFNSTGFEGQLTKEVFIRSDDPLSSSAVVTLNVTVKTILQPRDTMYNLWLGNAAIGIAVKKIFFYHNISEQPLAITGGSSTASDVAVKVPAVTLKPGEEGSAELVITATKEGYTQSDFQISCSNKNQQALVLRVTYIGVKSP